MTEASIELFTASSRLAESWGRPKNETQFKADLLEQKFTTIDRGSLFRIAAACEITAGESRMIVAEIQRTRRLLSAFINLLKPAATSQNMKVLAEQSLKNHVASLGKKLARKSLADDEDSIDQFSVRVRKAIYRAGIRKVSQLIMRTSDDLLELKNFGQTCLREVEEKLASLGLSLASPLSAVTHPSAPSFPAPPGPVRTSRPPGDTASPEQDSSP